MSKLRRWNDYEISSSSSNAFWGGDAKTKNDAETKPIAVYLYRCSYVTVPPFHSRLRCRLSALRDRISCRQQLCPAPRKHLAPCLYTLHIIRRRQTFIGLEVFVEVEQIAAVTRGIRNGDEAVYGRSSVRTDDEVELGGPDCWRGGRGGRVAVVAEWGDRAEVTEPDHDFVGLS